MARLRYNAGAVLDATSLVRLTVVRFAGTAAAVERAWEHDVQDRVSDSDLVILDLQRAELNAALVARLAARAPRVRVLVTHEQGTALDAAQSLNGSMQFVVRGRDVQLPGKIENVIWEEIDLTSDTSG